jgi:hypothetical protein
MVLRRATGSVLAAFAVACAACGPAPGASPVETPVPPITAPVATAPQETAPGTAAVTPKPAALAAGTRTVLASRKDDTETWDKMLIAGGRLWIVAEVNRWTTGPMYVPAARLYSMPLAGGALTKHLDLEGLAAIAADDAALFVAVTKDLSTVGTPRAKAATGRIFRMPLAGGALVDLATAIEPKVLAVDESRVWFDGSFIPKVGDKAPAPSGAKAPLALAVDATHLYFTSKGGRVWRVAKAGGAAQLLAERLPDEPAAIAVDASHVYVSAVSWASAADQKKGVVARVAKEGGALEILAKDVDTPRGAWLSPEHAFVVTGRAGRPGAVLRIPKAGGEPAVAAEDRTLGHVALDERTIYVTSDGTFEPETKKRLGPPLVLGFTR